VTDTRTHIAVGPKFELCSRFASGTHTMMPAACVHLVKYMHTHNLEQLARVARVVGGRGGVWKIETPKDSLGNGEA
jgi:hypothetical protein